MFRGAGSSHSASSRKSHDEQWDEVIPSRVDAHDDFESREKKGDATTDALLASQTLN